VSVTIFTDQEQKALSDKWTWARFLFGPGGVLGIWALWNQWPADAGQSHEIQTDVST
jgi:hypothetical protein